MCLELRRALDDASFTLDDAALGDLECRRESSQLVVATTRFLVRLAQPGLGLLARRLACLDRRSARRNVRFSLRQVGELLRQRGGTCGRFARAPIDLGCSLREPRKRYLEGLLLRAQ